MSRKIYGDMEDEEEYMKPMLPTVPEKCGPPVISLGHLIEFAVQQIFHELTVLSELLPKKLDSDRKISIVQFAHSTRTLFIKLLAVVKWVKSSKKFESCASICYFLDQQSQYFIDTADRLVQLAREDLIHARLPAFQIPAAVDVLTLGTYPRLPVCIKSRFIRPSEITAREQASILARLNQVLQTRISICAKRMSPRITSVLIKNGMVTLTVPGEFSVSLSLLGERDTTKWTLLNIKILVEDYEIGYGTKLVHPLQVNMLHNVLQLRMDKADDAISEVYNFLHSFAQSLQLDVLYCQATQAVRGPMRQYTTIDRYDRTQGILIISYWLKKTHHNRFSSQYRIKISSSADNINSGLRVRHYPDGKNLPKIDDRTGRLSISGILSETVVIRCRERLLQIRECLKSLKPFSPVSLTGKAAPTLTYPLLGPESNQDEMLIISVNGFSGDVLVIVRALGSRLELCELERFLNDRSSIQRISSLIYRLRILLMMERYRKSIASLAVRIVPEKTLSVLLPNISSLPSDRLCLQFVKEDAFFLIISWKSDDIKGFDIDMYLFCNTERKTNMIRLHPSQVLSSSPSSNFSSYDKSIGMPSVQRKRWIGNVKELSSAIAIIDDRIAFMRICEELSKRCVSYQPVTKEPVVGGLLLQISDFSGALPSASKEFFSSMTNCCLRLDTRSRVIWPFECTLTETPLIADIPGSANVLGKRSRTKLTVMEINGSGGISSLNTSESVSIHMLDRLTIFSHMYEPVREFADAYYSYYNQYCNIVAFTYHKLVIAYGTNRNYLVIISWKSQKTTKPYFYLTLGIWPNQRNLNNKCEQMNENVWNPHILMHQRLQEQFNRHRSLCQLMQYLIDTISPLCCLHNFIHMRLHSLRAYCQLSNLEPSLPITLQANLSVIDEHTIRLLYGNIHLEFLLVGGYRVGVRDCGRGGVSAHRLKTFCNKFVSPEMRSANDEPSAYLNWMHSSSSGPGSLPPHQITRSPASRIAASPMSYLSLSVPPADTVPSPLRHPQGDHLRCRSPILIDHGALQTMTAINDSGTCPLEDYLFSLSYLSRLGPALESYRRDNRGNSPLPAIHLKSLLTTPELIRISVSGAVPPSPRNESFLAVLNVYLDDDTMSLKLRIDFENSSPPSESDLRIFERYFKRYIARSGNEIAFIAFSNACRIVSPGIFSSIARIMEAQMDWSENSPWRPSLQLTMWNQEGSTSRARISPGIAIDQTNTNILIPLCLRPTKRKDGERNADASKYVIPLIYNTQTNMITRRNSEEDSSNASTILLSITEQYSHTTECPLWFAVNSLAYKFVPSNTTSGIQC